VSHVEAAEILASHNAWRRGDETIPQLPPKLIGEAIDVAVEALRKLSSIGAP
jgi:hypothetical protein